MSILNFASNKFFDNDDYALSAVPKARLAQYELFSLTISSDAVNPNIFPLQVDLIEVSYSHYCSTQTPTLYVVIADIPGVSKDRVKVSVKDDKVMIEGKRKKKVISNDDTYIINERRNGTFKKLLQMPMDADSQQMSAKIEDGMLVLTIPRVKEIEGAKTVEINQLCYL